MKIGLAIPVLLLVACGGAAPATVHKTPTESAPGKTKVSDAPPKEEEGRGGVQCEDGSCFACGEAICLSGFFCSVGKTGHGCAWMPSCAGKATCSCIAPSLREDPSCTCQERDGGVYVTCEGAKL